MTIGSRATVKGTVQLGNTVLPWEQYVQSLAVELVTNGSWTAQLTLFDPTGDALESLILAQAANRNIDVTFGWEDQESAWRRLSGYTLQYQPTFEPAGTTLVLEIVARSIGAALLNKKIRSFPDGTRASDIVLAIAADNGWRTSDLKGRLTVERTEPPLENPCNTSGESDMKFIADMLVPQAVNAQGIGGFRAFFDEEGAYHFHTPNFLPGAIKNYRFGHDISGEVLSFAPQDTAIFGVLNGGGNSRFTSAASLEGGTSEAKSSITSAFGSTGQPQIQDASAKTGLGSGLHSVVNFNVRHTAENERRARHLHALYSAYQVQGALSVIGTHDVRIVDYIDFAYIKRDGTQHYLSGSYQVFKINHNVEGGGWTTEFTVLRTGIAPQPGTDPLVASSTVSPSEFGGGDDSVSIEVES